MAYSFSVVACPLSEFSRRAQMARDAAMNPPHEGLASGAYLPNAEEQEQSQSLVDFAILTAQKGHLGEDWVGAEFSGHCNEGHLPVVGKGDSTCSFAVWQTGPRP